MGLPKQWSFIVFISIISSMVKGSQQCFSEDRQRLYERNIDAENYYEEDCYCDPGSKQNADLSWLGPDGKEIKVASGLEINPVFVTHERSKVVLTIQRMSSALAGTYKCVAKQKDGSQNVITYDFKVHFPIYFMPANLTRQFVISGQDSLIRCTARGDEQTDVSWHKDGIGLLDENKYERSDEGLLIKSATQEDEGEYRCSAVVPSTGEYESVDITVEAYVPPKIVSITSSGGDQVVEGDELTLTCKASGYPLPSYSWRKVDTVSVNTGENIPATKSQSWKQELNKIVFESVTIDDDGWYECIANNSVGYSPMIKTIRVLAPPMITEFNSVEVVEDNGVSINCTAIGRPLPDFNIECENTPAYQKVNTYTDNWTRSRVTLTFEKIDRNHRGYCYCRANNSVNSSEATMFLEVLHKPYLTSSDEVVWSYDNSSLTLNCEHEARPPATVQWSYQGDKKFTETLLQIRSNIAEWMASVSSKTETNLTLNELNVNLFYGNYECFVKNYLGEAKKQFVVKRGFPPARLTGDQIALTDITATSITFDIRNKVSIDAPPIIGYTAEYDEAYNYNFTDIHINRTWAFNVPYKIDRLKPGTTYTIRFAALNLAGAGPFGDYYNFTTPEKSVPESPILEMLPDSPMRIPADNKVLKLKYPEDNGDPIDYYVIKYCRIDTDECMEEKVTLTTELDLKHLSSNTSYDVEIMAHNSVGNSTSAFLQIFLDAEPFEEAWLTAEGIIGIALVVVIICILILDVLLFCTIKKGMIASCFVKKNKKEKDDNKKSRDKKGLLKDNGDSGEPPKRPDNGHKEFEYNKSTGIITGKHSAV